jgi:hypothetical protein
VDIQTHSQTTKARAPEHLNTVGFQYPKEREAVNTSRYARGGAHEPLPLLPQGRPGIGVQLDPRWRIHIDAIPTNGEIRRPRSDIHDVAPRNMLWHG